MLHEQRKVSCHIHCSLFCSHMPPRDLSTPKPESHNRTCKNVHTDKLNFAQVVKVPNTAQVYKQ